jgi:hypothetical protein
MPAQICDHPRMALNLLDLIASAVADPGKHVTRLGVGFKGFDADEAEPLHVWQGRAVAAALALELGRRVDEILAEPFNLADYCDSLRDEEQRSDPAADALASVQRELRA